MKLTYLQLEEINRFIEMAQKRFKKFSPFSVENEILKKYQVFSLNDIKASDGEKVMEDIREYLIKRNQ